LSRVKLRNPTAHGGQLGRSNERKIAGIKQQDKPPVEEIIQGDLSSFRPVPAD
jgi:hypothetical protein